MLMYKVSPPSGLHKDSKDVEAFVTPTGLQILKSIDKIPDEGEKLHVSIGSDNNYPSERIVKRIAKHFFHSVNVEACRKPSEKPPPDFVIHLFGDVPT